MAKINRNAKTWALAGILKRINLGEDPRVLRNEIIQLSKNVDPEDIAGAEQTLIAEGYSDRVVQRLSAMFTLMSLQKSKDGNSTGKLPDDHILRKIRVEHDLIGCYLTDLDKVVETIRSLNCLTDVSSEFRNLGHILGHLSAMKEHIDREEDIIFPYLRKSGWTKLCQSALNEHGRIRIDIDNLLALMTSFNEIGFDDFRGWLITIVHRFSAVMREHLSYENELLYPISLFAIDDANVWERMQALCDEIGYCGVHNPLC
ncbi:MAG: DUF438 domain-containing protein [Planctomycetota bacterium]|jgi:DUF438 domain-containing protein